MTKNYFLERFYNYDVSNWENVIKLISGNDALIGINKEGKVYFTELGVQVAGKTGTAEQSTSRPNHALFVGYAPYNKEPEIAVTTRILFGYSSDYAAQTTRDIISYYYGLEPKEDIVTGVANTPGAGISNNEI